MSTRVSLKTFVRAYGMWVALLAIPLIVNGALWKFLVVPQRAELRAWRETQVIAELRPKLESLLTQSGQMLTDVSRTSFTQQDPSAVMQAVKRLAGLHHVQVKEVRMAGQEVTSGGTTIPGFSTMPMELSVSGRFSKLAQWISDVEGQSGLQVDSWTMTPGTGPSDPHQLSVKLTAFLRET